MAYNYDKSKDYTKLMQDAANSGNWEQAAIYEQQRNAKIAGEGLNQYQTSQNYARYLPTQYGYDANTDYQRLMDQAAAGGDMARAAIYEQQRNQKIREGNGGTHTMSYNYTDYLPGMSQQVGKQGYKNPYLDQLNEAINRLGDESALRQQYLMAAKKGTEDTLGAYAANTGGIASTGAVAAAQQAGDNYRSQMGTALQSQRQQYANALMNASSMAQSDYQLNIQEAMNRWTQLGYADDFVSQILGVAPGTGTASQNYQLWSQRFQQQQALQSQQATDRNQAYTTVMNLLQTGATPSAELLEAAGIDRVTAAQLGNYYSTQQSYQQTMQLLNAGVMPSEDMLASAGLTQEQAEIILANQKKTSTARTPGTTTTTTGKKMTGTQLTKLLNAYAKGDGSWKTIAQGYEYDGVDLTEFYNRVGRDPDNPYAEKTVSVYGENPTGHSASGTLQQMIQSYRALLQSGGIDANAVARMLLNDYDEKRITLAEARQIAEALGIEIN